MSYTNYFGLVQLTKDKADQLDLLFNALLNWKGERSQGLIDISVVVRSLNGLSHLDSHGIHDLLYLARIEQKKVPEFFSGDTLLSINEPALRDFVSLGGFGYLYSKERKARDRDNSRFWSIFVITIITLLIAIWQLYLQSYSTQNNEVSGSTNSTAHGDSTTLIDSSLKEVDSLELDDSSLHLRKR